jgi:hypothetical protein
MLMPMAMAFVTLMKWKAARTQQLAITMLLPQSQMLLAFMLTVRVRFAMATAA